MLTEGMQAETIDLTKVQKKVHSLLMERLDLRVMERMEEKLVRAQIRATLRDLIAENDFVLNQSEQSSVIENVENEILGMGPLEPLLNDPSICDILVNTYKTCYVERHGMLEKVPINFQNDDHLLRIIQKIAGAVGRRVDESSPMVDARLADGSRVNAIIPPLAVDGPLLSIRKFAVDPLTVRDLMSYRSLTPPIAQFLEAAVKARTNILISGGTGSGKTTLLNVVSSFIPHTERILTIEDSAELQLQQPHVGRLETRPPNIEGKGAVLARDLVKNALRMRPDRIVLGEVRGEEALDMLQAMNTGHDGSLGTIHANSPRDAISRLEHMIGMAGISISPNVIRQQIAAALDLIVQTERLPDGRRAVMSISEITGMEQNVVNMQDIFQFKRQGVDDKGRVKGTFIATGIRPAMMQRIKERGIELDESIFDPDRVYE
ncbi:tad secretion sytem protein, secretion ATPase [Alcanivorax nanhaiticus]|uniref:Tad secretion sytem protein, secretion ATPase n=1 Tax=Alcanivorax nanhaiticus TaxID=1177154 RepID=A0A095SJK1_9GAMM|nr:CpaF family protein [Alcanivorax nanhaiticus]KGD64509.1 tad secretion sytem protein, secretion ATPase [Alcanivorax nanhaiticus]